MKAFLGLSLIYVLGHVEAAVLDKRQSAMKPLKAYKIESVKPVYFPDAKRLKFTYGPFKVGGKDDASPGNGKSGDPHGTAYEYLADIDFPRDITVLGTTGGLLTEKSQKLTLADGLTTDYLTCGKQPGKKVAQPKVSVFMAAGLEETELRYSNPKGSIKSGYYISPNSSIFINVDIVNYNSQAKSIYLVGEMEYLPGKDKALLPAEHTVIDIGFCDGADGLNVQPPADKKQWSIQSSPMVANTDGYLIFIGGHLHDGGTNMVLTINGKAACDSVAKYGGKGAEGKAQDGSKWESIAAMARCDEVRIKKGDMLAMQANYDVEKHPARKSSHGEMAEGMALMTGAFVAVS